MSSIHARRRMLADSQFGGGSTTWAPATWYLAFLLAAPLPDGTGFTEPTHVSYARPAITNNATNFPAATTSVDGVTTKTNGTDFVFPDPTGTWGLLRYWAWFTVLTGGSPQYWGKLDSEITVVAASDSPTFVASTLVMPWA